MTARSRQAHLLSYLLEKRLGLRGVQVHYLGAGRDHAYSGWHIEWGNGPTVDEMRQVVTDLAEQVPAIAGADLRYSRGQTDLGEAVALLRYLDAHPDQAPHANTFTTTEAFDWTSYPERSEDIWMRRARALIAAVPDNRHMLTGDAVRLLADHARRGGWPTVLTWLDDIATAAEDPTVTNLAEARARRAEEGRTR